MFFVSKSTFGCTPATAHTRIYATPPFAVPLNNETAMPYAILRYALVLSLLPFGVLLSTRLSCVQRSSALQSARLSCPAAHKSEPSVHQHQISNYRMQSPVLHHFQKQTPNCGSRLPLGNPSLKAPASDGEADYASKQARSLQVTQAPSGARRAGTLLECGHFSVQFTTASRPRTLLACNCLGHNQPCNCKPERSCSSI